MIYQSVKNKTSIKIQLIAALIAIVAAVALPQLVHTVGLVSGTGTALGEILLPMHLPVILVGLLAGTYAGAIAGALSPVISFAITAMPTSVMLPFMVIELCVYGAVAGLLKEKNISSIWKVLIAQISGRAIRAVAILFSVYVLSASKLPVSIIWTSIPKGLFGIILQLVLLPLIVFYVDKKGSEL